MHHIKSSTNLPASPLSDRPWHPQTLNDIRDLDLNDLPDSYTFGPLEGYLQHTGAMIVGSDEEIKEKMEGAFLHWPNMCFAIKLPGVLMFEKIETDEK